MHGSEIGQKKRIRRLSNSQVDNETNQYTEGEGNSEWLDEVKYVNISCMIQIDVPIADCAFFTSLG